MGLFTKAKAPQEPFPEMATAALPDPNWTRRHLRDVAAMIEGHDLHKSRTGPASAGAMLGAALTADVPAHLSELYGEDAIRASVQAAAVRGYAFAALHPTSPLTPDLWDALQYVSWLAVVREMDRVAALQRYAVMAGHYLGSHAGHPMDRITDSWSWAEVERLSPRVAVMAEVVELGWLNLCAGK